MTKKGFDQRKPHIQPRAISSYEALSILLGVDSLETLLLLSLLNDTRVCQEETDDNRHKSIHSTEDIVQRHVCKFGDRSDAEAVHYHGRSCIRTKGTTKRDFISGVEITAAHERILNGNLGGIALHSEHFVIVVALVKRRNPDRCADDENRNAIGEEQPVEHDEGSFPPYGNENEGADEGCQEGYPQNSSTSQVKRTKGEVEEKVGLAPDERENERYEACGQEAGIKETPGKHETLGHHLDGANGFERRCVLVASRPERRILDQLGL